MTGAPFTITKGRLAPQAVRDVLSLTDAAAVADGVAPMSEAALLHVRHGGAPGVRDFLLALPDGTAAGYAQLASAGDEAPDDDRSGELVVHPAHRRKGFGMALASALTGSRGGQGDTVLGDSGQGHAGQGIRVWAHGDLPAAAALAKAAGFARVRSLWQMRMDLAGAALPEAAFPAGVTVRAFRPGADEDAWLAVNRRAFAHHPEQGSWTRQDLALREAEDWFDPAGFFLAERDGRLAGFHWTKVHPAGGPGGGPVGEVYVVGIDPDQQGGGLGRALTIRGLAHLKELGLAQVMLYVDESNVAATQMYTRLGFSRWSADVMYRHP